MPETQVKQRWIYFFGDGDSECDPGRNDILGGKGAGLAAMCRAGLPVPPGFTISVEACRAFHQRDGLWPDGLESEIKSQLSRLESLTGQSYGQGRNPLLVSVRSGAAVSMPGMMDTILNCGLHPGLVEQFENKDEFRQIFLQFVGQYVKAAGDVAPDEVKDPVACQDAAARALISLYESKTGKMFPLTPWDALKACIEAVFNSWYSRRAVLYRQAHDIRGVEGTAVNIQSMFHSQVSGVAFTVNPADPAAREIVIESSLGLGESVVSGVVTPDRFMLDRDSLDLKSRVIGHKGQVMFAVGSGAQRDFDPDLPSLEDNQVDEVARTALKVETFFGYPVDIEWGFKDGKIALLQSRAIRGLDIAADVETGRLEEIERLRRKTAGSQKVWVIHNLAETLPSPTPLTWDVVSRFMSGDGGFGLMYRDFGYVPSASVCREGFLDLINGRIYADPDRAAALFWGALPFCYDHRKVLESPSVLESAPAQFDPSKADGMFFLRLPAAIWAMLRSSHTLKNRRKTVKDDFEKAVLPGYLDYIEKCRRTNLAVMPTAALVAEFQARADRVLHDFGKESLKPGFFGGCAYAELESLLVQLMGTDKGGECCRALTSGLPGDTTVEQNVTLYKLAKGEGSLAEFLERYGHRAVREMELAQPRWREDPSYLENAIEQYKNASDIDPEQFVSCNRNGRLEIEAGLSAMLDRHGGGFLEQRIRTLILEAQTLLPYREIGKHYLMMGYETLRMIVAELGRRWDVGRDVCFLRLSELVRFENERDAMLKRMAARKVRWLSAQRLDMPDVIDSQDLDRLGLRRHVEGACEMPAVSLAPGLFDGIARIVYDPGTVRDLGDRCVLVCPSTDPGWTVLFASIRGLIVERGGVLSHGAITARDFSIPAVACADATRMIKDGQRVRVDGDRGRVSILEDMPKHGNNGSA